MRTNSIIILIVLILAILVFIINLSIDIYQGRECNKKCEEVDGLGYEVINNGEWNLNDLCVCYGKSGIRAWRLGK